MIKLALPRTHPNPPLRINEPQKNFLDLTKVQASQSYQLVPEAILWLAKGERGRGDQEKPYPASPHQGHHWEP